MPLKLFTIRTLKGVVLVPAKYIMWLQSDNGYTLLHIQGGSKLIISGSIKQHFERLQALGRFVRIHRSYAINVKYLRQIVRGSHVLLTGNIQIPLTSGGEDNLSFLLNP